MMELKRGLEVKYVLTSLKQTLTHYAMTHRSQLPRDLDDLAASEEVNTRLRDGLKTGDVVVAWGQSANRLVWAYAKATPVSGGSYLRYDGKVIENVMPEEFAKVKDVPLTAATVPEDVSQRFDPQTKPDYLKKYGFWLGSDAVSMLHGYKGGPANYDEFPRFMARSGSIWFALKAIEDGQVVIRYGKPHWTEGLIAHSKNYGEKGGWGVHNNVWNEHSLEEAKKFLSEP